MNNFVRTIESVGCDPTPCFLAGNPEYLYRDTVLPYVPNGSWRVIVSVDALKFFAGYGTMLDDMINNSSRPFSRYLIAKSEYTWINV